MAVTHIAAAAGALSWMAAEWAVRGRPSLLGLCSGLVAGLVAITPAAGFVSPRAALVFGVAAGLACYWGATGLKRLLDADDSLDVFGVHGVGGIVGSLLTGVFASKAISGAEGSVLTQAIGAGSVMTESAPFAIFVTNPHIKAGDLGVPTPGLELKLVDVEGKTEVRYKGPNITPGYWRAPQDTAEAFDEEGFFRTGDAVQWIDDGNIHLGLKFDGRIAEDFKLATGTFVSVGPLRAKIIAAGAPYVQDVVLTGINLKEVGALVFPTPAVRSLSRLAPEATLREVLECEQVIAHFQDVLNQLAQNATGSASCIGRMRRRPARRAGALA